MKYASMTNLQSFAVQFVASARRYLFVRPQDGVLILRRNKVRHLGWQQRMDSG